MWTIFQKSASTLVLFLLVLCAGTKNTITVANPSYTGTSREFTTPPSIASSRSSRSRRSEPASFEALIHERIYAMESPHWYQHHQRHHHQRTTATITTSVWVGNRKLFSFSEQMAV